MDDNASSPQSGTRSNRHGGVYYTPLWIVQAIVRWALDDLLRGAPPERPLRILEPACGQGVFLIEAFRDLERRLASSWQIDRLEFSARRELLLSSIFGVDMDGKAVLATRRRLAEFVAGGLAGEVQGLERELNANIRCGDTLIDTPLAEPDGSGFGHVFDWDREFPCVALRDGGGFDAVIGNPPYVNARLLLQGRGKVVKQYFKQRYRSARGGFDLYVLFMEKAFELLRPGGVCGFIVPNKIAGSGYARKIRELLTEQCRIRRLVDLSSCRVFPDANVYPYIVIWEKTPPTATHHVRVQRANGPEDTDSDAAVWQVPQAELSARHGWQLCGRLDVESRVATVPLAELASLHAGTTGFSAAKIAAVLGERAEGEDGFDFIVSGNIDRYRIRLGDVRYMKRDYRRPVLPRQSAVISESKRQLFRQPKIVVAGMTRRLEAAWDDAGLALGVQVYAVCPTRIAPYYLLALLNSTLFSYLYRMRFHAKQLSGGYMSINKSQLASLPIAVPSAEDATGQQTVQRLVSLARRLEQTYRDGESRVPSQQLAGLRAQAEAMEEAIDACVYSLYRLPEEEVNQIREKF